MKQPICCALLALVCIVMGLLAGSGSGPLAVEAYGKKHSHGHVKIHVWRGPSVGHKKHKHAPFKYHFSIDEKGH